MQSRLTSKKDITWTAIRQPEPEELTQFVRDTKLLPIDAEFIAQNYHRPEITVRDQYVLILVHVPVFNKQTRVTTGVPLYIVVHEGGVSTLHYEPIIVLEKLIQDFTTLADLQEEHFGDGPLGLSLYILNVIYGSAFNKIERLFNHINIAEDAVFQGNERRMVEEIAILVRDVMDFRKIIRPQRLLFATLPAHSLVTADTHAAWQRLHGQVNKLWDLLESLAESAKELSQVNGKLLQLKENELLQFLTYYSILSIPAFIVLNPINPRAANVTTTDLILYWGVLGLLVLILVFIFVRFRGKRVL